MLPRRRGRGGDGFGGIMIWLVAVVASTKFAQGQDSSRGEPCDVCSAASEIDLEALARLGKGIVCDPSCLDDGGLYCDALGLGQICRFCGECEACKHCPDDSDPVDAGTAAPTSYDLPQHDDDCARCGDDLSEADAIALSNGDDERGVICDPSCLTGDTLYCNIFGLGQICRLCGSCHGCKPCTEGSTSNVTDPPTPSPTSLDTLCPVDEPSTLECSSGQEGLRCNYGCFCCNQATETNEFCEPADQNARDVCDFSRFYSCEDGVWVVSEAFFKCPTTSPTGAPIGGEVTCSVYPPDSEECSKEEEGNECVYGCFCCDADTEADENCEPTDPLSTDKCTFTNFFWCEKGVWINAMADPYCPSW